METGRHLGVIDSSLYASSYHHHVNVNGRHDCDVGKND